VTVSLSGALSTGGSEILAYGVCGGSTGCVSSITGSAGQTIGFSTALEPCYDGCSGTLDYTVRITIEEL
jgi:hypothetical protein